MARRRWRRAVSSVARSKKSSTDLRRPCGPSSGSAPPLLVYEWRFAHCAARRFTRIWATWIAESLAEDFRARHALVQLPAGGVGLAASRVAHRDVQPFGRHELLEPADALRRRGFVRRVVDRVEG